MRFLLHAASAASKATTATMPSPTAAALSGGKAVAAATKLRVMTPPSPSSSAGVGKVEVSWGQRCSPRCGCIIRFESTSDVSTGRIVSAVYHAKSVMAVADDDDGKLRPQMAQRGSSSSTGRPLLTGCKCANLHSLASTITCYLPGRTVHSVRNSTEYNTVRSSDSFRRTALVAQGLPPSAGHCYDLVEEAFLAAIRGYIPCPRRRDVNYSLKGQKRRKGKTAMEEERDLDPLRYAHAARRAGRTYGKAGVPGENMPSYRIGRPASSSVWDGGDDGGIGDVSVTSATGASTSVAAAAEGMPTFHMDLGLLDHVPPSALMSKYDDTVDELCREIDGCEDCTLEDSVEDEGDNEENEEEEEEGTSRVGTTLLNDWVSHVDNLYFNQEGKQG